MTTWSSRTERSKATSAKISRFTCTEAEIKARFVVNYAQSHGNRRGWSILTVLRLGFLGNRLFDRRHAMREKKLLHRSEKRA